MDDREAAENVVAPKVAQKKICRGCRQEKPRGDFRPAPAGRGQECRECRLERQKARRRDLEHAYRIGRNFGISVEEYGAMLLAQDGACGICRRKAGKRRLAVDHCHETGKVRGLLCTACNTGLGALGDSAEVIDRVMLYLFGEKDGRSAPRKVTIVRYLDQQGRRVKKGTPGATAVTTKSRGYYAKIRGRNVPLRTTDEAEAVRRLEAIRGRQ